MKIKKGNWVLDADAEFGKIIEIYNSFIDIPTYTQLRKIAPQYGVLSKYEELIRRKFSCVLVHYPTTRFKNKTFIISVKTYVKKIMTETEAMARLL